MSSDSSPPSPGARRASFAASPNLTNMFARPPTTPGAFPGPIAAAAANASAHQRRRMSISTLGLSGSPNQSSPFSARSRQESVSSSSTSPGFDSESAIDESGDAFPPSAVGTSPFGRRMSFGARAMRDARGGGSGNSFNGEGFNWSEQIRSRAERSASISTPNTSSPVASIAPVGGHHKAASVAAAEPPIKEMPKISRAPDPFQERILKGDFYMD